MDFVSMRTAYNNCREEEKNKIIQRLRQEGYATISYSKGKGVLNYTANGKLQKEYDLSLWKWIEIQKDGICFFISLQAFDNNNAGGNKLVLFDRLGIYGPYKCGEYNSARCFNEMDVTEIELPMNEDKLNELVDLLRNKYADVTLK